jgi:hypothetical protein
MTERAALIRRECWEYNRELEKIEGVRRCSFCAAREDRHNLPEDMAYYGYKAHPFGYPTDDEIAGWQQEKVERKQPGMITEGYFVEKMHEVDSLCEVDFETYQFGIRLRPSHPRYREALIEQANLYRTAGIVLYAVREVDEQVIMAPPERPFLAPTRVPWWARILGFLS